MKAETKIQLSFFGANKVISQHSKRPMATATSKNKQSNKKVKAPQQEALTPQEQEIIRKKKLRNIRLFIGFIFLLLGVFWTVSIIGYIFSWKADQDALLSNRTIAQFLFEDKSPITNWCGRFGAAMAHLLVFRSLGISSLFVTSWVAAIGVNLVNGKKIVPTEKWIRIMAMGFLFLCPFLAFAFKQTSFPLGGALGNSIVNWTEGFAGPVGTIFTLITSLLIFVFIVFQWDIKPLIERLKTVKLLAKEPVLADAQSFPVEPEITNDINNQLDTNNTQENDHTDNHFNHNSIDEDEISKSTIHIEESLLEDENAMVNLDLTYKSTDPAAQRDGISIEMPEEHVADPILANIPTLNAEDDFEIIETHKDPIIPPAIPQITNIDDTNEIDTENNDEEEDYNNWVKAQQNTHLPQNGAHITIADNQPYDPSLDLPNYQFPALGLLEDLPQEDIQLNREELQQNKDQIVTTLRSFGIEIQKIMATVGPTVTLYEIIPAEGVRISKIRNLEDDIALNLAALGIRIIAPIPGRGTIGIEVPNRHKQVVSMKTLIASDKFVNNSMSLPIALGKKIDNENYIVDLAEMPHLLMAGATGQGKSVGINAILVSLLYKKHPSQLKFVMVDPKKVELSIYRKIEKHYLAKLPNEEEAIITDTKKVVYTLNALGIEMDNRYELLKDAGARNLKEYNKKFIDRRLNPNEGHKFLPFIVLVIDEFADLIMTAGKEIEMPIARLAQLARAVGIHLIIATQRPSVNIITGIIKANFPARIAFRVTSKIDSRTILDAGGADQLIGRGDMLISYKSELVRVQCAFVDTPEVEKIVSFIGDQKGYPSAFELPEYEGAEESSIEEKNIDLSKRDKMFEECARMVVNSQSGSTSMLQRKFNLGYNRAGRIMDQLEAAGIVGPTMGSKPRDVMVSTESELNQILESFFR